MARPRKFDLDDVKERLMNTFWRHGYTRTSLPHLTAASGLLRGSLYAAFGEKDAMFSVALGRYLDQLRHAILSDASGIDGLRYTLDAVVQITIDDPERRGCLLINAIPEAQSLGAANRQAIDQGLAEMRLFIGARLREAQETSTQKPDLEPLIALVFAASVAIRVLGRAGEEPQLLQDIADGAVAAVQLAFQPTVTTDAAP